jgi:hypothetical protein
MDYNGFVVHSYKNKFGASRAQAWFTYLYSYRAIPAP